MAKKGSEYQERAAEFFRSLGLTAEVEERVEGARGAHDIDVWVTGKIHAFDVRWVVECKDWKSNVPKEKVLALQAIAQDVGADRAFLLSEQGFQAGAIRCAQFTNITLTSIQELNESTSQHIAAEKLFRLIIRLGEIRDQLYEVRTHLYTRRFFCSDPIQFRFTELGQLQVALIDGLHRGFPTFYAIKGSATDVAPEKRYAKDAKELIESATGILAEIAEDIEYLTPDPA